jgi:hypothetical protein
MLLLKQGACALDGVIPQYGDCPNKSRPDVRSVKLIMAAPGNGKARWSPSYPAWYEIEQGKLL